MATDAHDPDAAQPVLTPVQERNFDTYLVVRVRSHGHPSIHGPKIEARVRRELELMFHDSWVGQLRGNGWLESQLGAIANSSGPESSATSGSNRNGAQSAEEGD